MTERDPQVLRPLLLGSRGGVEQEAISARADKLFARQAKINGGVGHVAERKSGERAVAPNGVKILRNRMPDVV